MQGLLRETFLTISGVLLLSTNLFAARRPLPSWQQCFVMSGYFKVKGPFDLLRTLDLTTKLQKLKGWTLEGLDSKRQAPKYDYSQAEREIQDYLSDAEQLIALVDRASDVSAEDRYLAKDKVSDLFHLSAIKLSSWRGRSESSAFQDLVEKFTVSELSLELETWIKAHDSNGTMQKIFLEFQRKVAFFWTIADFEIATKMSGYSFLPKHEDMLIELAIAYRHSPRAMIAELHNKFSKVVMRPNPLVDQIHGSLPADRISRWSDDEFNRFLAWLPDEFAEQKPLIHSYRVLIKVTRGIEMPETLNNLKALLAKGEPSMLQALPMLFLEGQDGSAPVFEMSSSFTLAVVNDPEIRTFLRSKGLNIAESGRITESHLINLYQRTRSLAQGEDNILKDLTPTELVLLRNFRGLRNDVETVESLESSKNSFESLAKISTILKRESVDWQSFLKTLNTPLSQLQPAGPGSPMSIHTTLSEGRDEALFDALGSLGLSDAFRRQYPEPSVLLRSGSTFLQIIGGLRR